MSQDESLTEVRQLKEWLGLNRQSLMEAGVAEIVGEYQGEGDEGQFQEIHAIDANREDVSYDLPQEIADLIEALADRLATPGYEDGDGGGGEIRLAVDDGSIRHGAYWFVIERSSSEWNTY